MRVQTEQVKDKPPNGGFVFDPTLMKTSLCLNKQPRGVLLRAKGAFGLVIMDRWFCFDLETNVALFCLNGTNCL